MPATRIMARQKLVCRLKLTRFRHARCIRARGDVPRVAQHPGIRMDRILRIWIDQGRLYSQVW
ncbi:MAG TPA: hypothetical protein PKJ77_02735 [Thermodesulfobacteriota bacterium]|nr:hypothetical protein [Thermodesulfobacteriota bacterium]HOC38174.1 hypothetical protein [Thermodesulfobacteriota bacterium]